MTLTIKRIHHLPPINIIANAIRILRVKFHCNRLTTAQDIQNYVSLIFFGTQLHSTQREFTDAGETPHCPHLFIKIKYKTIRHILLVLIYLQFRLGRL